MTSIPRVIWTKFFLSGIAAVALGLTNLPALAQDDPMDWVVENNPGGAWRNYDDSVLMRRHDFGGDIAHPDGYGASDNVYCWEGSVCNTWQYSGNGAFNSGAGDGGQIISVVEGGDVSFWATQDGSYNGLQYLVGPACGVAGWKLFDSSVMNGPTTWISEVDQLRISRTSPNDCQSFSSSYTSWMRGFADFPYQNHGTYAGTMYLGAIVTEHYDFPTITASVNKEVNVFIKNIGLVYWLAYSRTAISGAHLAARCPNVTINGADSTTYWGSNNPDPGWHLVDCRYYMNYVPVPAGWNLSQYNWPLNQ